MSIEEKNRIIFDFMGCIHSKDADMDAWEMSTLRYHESWDWLMPVIEKISQEPLIGAETAQDVCYPVTFGMPHTDGTKMFRFAGFPVFNYETLIGAAYSAVIYFIKYHDNPSTEPQPEGKGKEGV